MSDPVAPIVEQLHAAADRIETESRTPPMDALAAAGAVFLRETDLSDEYGVPVAFTVEQAIGYGIMLGWLAHETLPRSREREGWRGNESIRDEFRS